MTNGKLEHVNITVGNAHRTAAMLAELFDWRVRWEGPALNGGHSIHLGTDDRYIAIHAARGSDALAPLQHRKGAPMNHIGIEVDDLDACERRATALGLEPFNHGDYAPGRRFYFFDEDGIEWEVASYAGTSTAAAA